MKYKIPLEQIKRDMEDPRYYISQQAKEYYYREYATDEERKRMDRSAKIDKIVRILVVGIITLIAVLRLLSII